MPTGRLGCSNTQICTFGIFIYLANYETYYLHPPDDTGLVLHGKKHSFTSRPNSTRSSSSSRSSWSTGSSRRLGIWDLQCVMITNPHVVVILSSPLLIYVSSVILQTKHVISNLTWERIPHLRLIFAPFIHTACASTNRMTFHSNDSRSHLNKDSFLNNSNSHYTQDNPKRPGNGKLNDSLSSCNKNLEF